VVKRLALEVLLERALALRVVLQRDVPVCVDVRGRQQVLLGTLRVRRGLDLERDGEERRRRTGREGAGQDRDVAEDRLERLVEDVCAGRKGSRAVSHSSERKKGKRGSADALDILYSKFCAATIGLRLRGGSSCISGMLQVSTSTTAEVREDAQVDKVVLALERDDLAARAADVRVELRTAGLSINSTALDG